MKTKFLPLLAVSLLAPAFSHAGEGELSGDTKLAILLTAALLAPGIASAAPANPATQPDLLTGDTKLACEAILCLSSGTRPSECAPSIRRFFSIKHKKLHKQFQARLDFLNLCPTDSAGMPELKRAIADGAGRCDAAELNRVMRRTIIVRECRAVSKPANGLFSGSLKQQTQECSDVQKSVVLNAKPSYCNAYHNHEWTHVNNVRYQGDPKSDGKWVDVKQ